DRLEMALAFLLVSPREHQAVTRWLAEPRFHEPKAVEKLRSLAAITDPYREALLPWTLKVVPIPDDAPAPAPAPAKAAEAPRPEAPRAARSSTSLIDSKNLDSVRQALECREILSGIYMDAELWETMLLVTMEPGTTRSALDKLVREPDGENSVVSQADL